MIVNNTSFLKHINIPAVAVCHWEYPCPRIPDVVRELKTVLSRSSLATRVKPGQRIAITAGSRGISHIDKLLFTLCQELKTLGADPFLVPAMGSHGGGTLEGQIKILAGYGITSETMGVPILGSEKPVEIGRTADGMPVFMDEMAFRSDGIMVLNRIKSHTSFQGTVESGICKMLAVGLGKDLGAQHIHRLGTRGLTHGIREAVQVIIQKAPVLLGVGIIENARGETAHIEAIDPEEFASGEARLLQKAKELTPIIPFKQADVLIVNEMGKDISGTGLDTNVIGRRMIAGETDPLYPRVARIVVLDLADSSDGNATGVGLADVITRRLYERIDVEKTLFNTIASTFIDRAKIPVTMPTDKSAIELALATCWVADTSKARIVWIKNTRFLETFAFSQALLPDALNLSGIRCSEEFVPLPFNTEGNLKHLF